MELTAVVEALRTVTRSHSPVDRGSYEKIVVYADSLYVVDHVHAAEYVDQVKRKGPESLPEVAPIATYLTLAPFVGAEEAYRAATEDTEKW